MSVIKAIFFSYFHDLITGPHLQHQVPEGSIINSADTSQPAVPGVKYLFDFSAVSFLLLPVHELCGRLITVCANGYRIVSLPVCVDNTKYGRNQFVFNFALVLHEHEDFSGYAIVVRKLAILFRNLEEQTNFLSKEEELGEQQQQQHQATRLAQERKLAFTVRSKMFALCEMIFEDINNHQECMIPIDDCNTVNLKIFPTRPPPVTIQDWHVPLATVQLGLLVNTSDITLTRIIPFIDGVSSVAHIAQIADTDPKLTCKALAHLFYYGCIILLDIFQYSAIYAPTADIAEFVEDEDAQQEAIRYIAVGRYRRLTKEESDEVVGDQQWAWMPDETGLTNTKLVRLYLSLCQSYTLHRWCLDNHILMEGIDVRRFITYGVMKGFLYRVHKYAALDGDAVTDQKHLDHAADQLLFDVEKNENWRASGKKRGSTTTAATARDLPLSRYLDGVHCMDEVCTELMEGDKDITEKIRALNVKFIYR